MAKTAAKEYVGILSPAFDWSALTQEEMERVYFRSFPDECYQELQDVRTRYARLEGIVNLQRKILDSVTRIMDTLPEERRLASIERKRLASLNQEAGVRENKRRADQFKTTVSAYVKGRYVRNRNVRVGDLAKDIRACDWAKKNKQGTKYGTRHLEDLVSPILAALKSSTN